MPRAAIHPIRVLHHRDADGWWAESPDVDGWSAAGDTYAEVVKLAEEGIPSLSAKTPRWSTTSQRASAFRSELRTRLSTPRGYRTMRS